MMQVLSVLTHNISSTKYDTGKNHGLSVLDTLPNTIKEELLYVSVCNLYCSAFTKKMNSVHWIIHGTILLLMLVY